MTDDECHVTSYEAPYPAFTTASLRAILRSIQDAAEPGTKPIVARCITLDFDCFYFAQNSQTI